MPAEQPTVLWPLIVYVVMVLGLVAIMLGLSSILGQRQKRHKSAEPYEGGIVSFGTARAPFNVQFYLIAVFFVIFDLEAAIIFAWAIALRPAGWLGFVEICIFIGVLIAGLVYLWRMGALEAGALRQGRSRIK